MTAHAADRDPSALRAALEAAAAALHLVLSERQSDQLLRYLAELERWNRAYNLTAIRTPGEMLTHHVVDCLAALPSLRRQRTGDRLLDVGSGGGLPGLVWAVAEPDLRVVCVDSVGKKTAFIQQAASALGLRNVESIHTRVEALERRFDIVASRAFASLSLFVSLTEGRVDAGGAWLALKGKRPDAELAELDQRIDVFHVEPLTVPFLAAERCLVWMRPSVLRSVQAPTLVETKEPDA